jgi:hypothetical protein
MPLLAALLAVAAPAAFAQDEEPSLGVTRLAEEFSDPLTTLPQLFLRPPRATRRRRKIHAFSGEFSQRGGRANSVASRHPRPVRHPHSEPPRTLKAAGPGGEPVQRAVRDRDTLPAEQVPSARRSPRPRSGVGASHCRI